MCAVPQRTAVPATTRWLCHRHAPPPPSSSAQEFMQLAYDHVSMAAYDPTSDATAWVIPAGGEEDGEEEALPVPLDEAAEEEVDIQP